MPYCMCVFSSFSIGFVHASEVYHTLEKLAHRPAHFDLDSRSTIDLGGLFSRLLLDLVLIHTQQLSTLNQDLAIHYDRIHLASRGRIDQSRDWIGRGRGMQPVEIDNDKIGFLANLQ